MESTGHCGCGCCTCSCEAGSSHGGGLLSGDRRRQLGTIFLAASSTHVMLPDGAYTALSVLLPWCRGATGTALGGGGLELHGWWLAHQPHHYHPLPQELQGLNGFQQVSAQLTGSACSPAAASHHTVHRCLWPLVSWHGSSFPFLAGLLLLGCSCLEVAPFLEVSLAGWVSTALGLSWACMEGGWLVYWPHGHHSLPQRMQGLDGFQQVSAQLTDIARLPAAAGSCASSSWLCLCRCLKPLTSLHGSSFPFLTGMLLVGCSCLKVYPL